MTSMDNKELTEKTLAAGLSAAVEQHDAEAVKEEITTVGRGNHTRQDIVISALPQGETGATNGDSLFGPTVRNSEASFSLRLLRRAFVA